MAGPAAVTLAAAGEMYRRLGSTKPTAGVLDSLANPLSLLAARSGDLAAVAVSLLALT
ncbi:hypothetical protein ACWGK6_15835 [Streptomyces violaceusniger]|uniref:hypothetical protein n=1 Tax=Streptomyces sp. Mo3 TaxID=3161190 RepID=UPI001F0956AF|nr:hypothetical protein [Streptomyces sp. 11-1-2]